MLKDVFAVLLLATFALMFLGVFLSWGRFRAGSVTAEESLDHPTRWTRYYYRFWSWCVSYGLGFLFTMALTRTLSERSSPDEPYALGLLLFVGALPPALLLYRLDRAFWRWASIGIRAQRRRLGYRGYQVPVTLDAPPVPVAFPTGQTPASMPASPLSEQDMRDPELVREVARKHWDAINFAQASGGDVSAALRRQQHFLDALGKQLPTEIIPQVLDTYSSESQPHAKRMAGIVRRQNGERRVQQFLREHARRKAVILFCVALGLMFVSALWEELAG